MSGLTSLDDMSLAPQRRNKITNEKNSIPNLQVEEVDKLPRESDSGVERGKWQLDSAQDCDLQ